MLKFAFKLPDCAQFHKAAQVQKVAQHNKVTLTSETIMSHVQFVTGVLLISTKQIFFKQYVPLEQLYDIGS